MTSPNFTKHNLLMHVITPSLLKLSLLMRCLMLKVFTEFWNIFFHRTTSNSKMTNQILVWQQWRKWGRRDHAPWNEHAKICTGAWYQFSNC